MKAGEKTPMHGAASSNNGKKIRRLIEDEKADVNAVDEANSTPLFWAVEFGCLEATIVLLEAGADVNAQDIIGKTPLDAAYIVAANRAAAEPQIVLNKVTNMFPVIQMLRDYGGKRSSELKGRVSESEMVKDSERPPYGVKRAPEASEPPESSE